MQVKVLIAILLLIIVGLLIPLPDAGRIGGCLQSMLHVPIFGLLGAVAYRIVNSRINQPRAIVMAVSWALVSAFGLAMESLQAFTGRSANWPDLLANISGGLAGISLISCMGTPWRQRTTLIAIGGISILIGIADPTLRLTDAVVQQNQMPLMASFESPLELYRWHFGASVASRVREHATHGSWSLQVELQMQQYPGVVLVNPVSDWSTYREVVADIFLVGDEPLELTVKIQDAEHNNDYYDRFNRVIRLLPGGNEIVVRLADVARAPRWRQLELGRIDSLSLFAIFPSRPRTFYLDNVRLR